MGRVTFAPVRVSTTALQYSPRAMSPAGVVPSLRYNATRVPPGETLSMSFEYGTLPAVSPMPGTCRGLRPCASVTTIVPSPFASTMAVPSAAQVAWMPANFAASGTVAPVSASRITSRTGDCFAASRSATSSRWVPGSQAGSTPMPSTLVRTFRSRPVVRSTRCRSTGLVVGSGLVT